MDILLQDLRYALRTLERSPGFTAIAIITLALGIGANSTIFSIVNAGLLRPVPGVAEPSRLVYVYSTNRSDRGLHSFSYDEYLDYKTGSHAFTDIEAESDRPVGVRVGDATQRMQATFASGNYFRVLGATPALGRFFTAEEDVAAGAKPVVVISYPFWRDRFASDPGILGRTLIVSGHELTIVGVAPEDFRGTNPVLSPAMWVPFHAFPAADIPVDIVNRANAGLRVIGRLAPGVNAARAKQDLTQIAKRLEKAYPDIDKDKSATVAAVGVFPAEVRGAATAFLTLLMVVVGLVLMIACANLANLLLARATARQREIAIRLALGASRARVIRQLLTESAVLGIIGGGAGVVLAVFATDLVSALKPPLEGFHVDIGLDWRVVLFTAAVSVATGILFGLAPAMQATRPSVVPALKEGGVPGYRRSRLRSGLVVAQFSVSLFLLIGAGLFVRSLRNAQSIDTGFKSDHVLLASVQPSIRGYDNARGRLFFDQLLTRLRATPGVRAAAVAENTPLGFGRQMTKIQTPRMKEGDAVDYNVVSASYFEAMRIPIVRGRSLSTADQRVDAPNGVIINETMARRYWPNEDAIGKTLKLTHGDEAPRLVIGIARDGKYRTLGEESTPFVYVPYEETSRTLTLHILTSGDPTAFVPILRGAVQALDNDMPIFDIKTMDQHMGISLLPARVAGGVLGVMGLLALVLAAVGIYGVMAFAVSQRTREIGIRMAIGARAADVLELFMSQGARLAIGGMTLGLLLAFGLTRFASMMLYGISASDPITFVSVSLLLGCVALLGIYVPARRATRVDPMIALRSE
jgi:predicted permease